MAEAQPFGHYEVERLIGAGGFATVYEAWDPRLSATVAIKVLADNHSKNPEIRHRFVDEGQVTRRIDSDSIIKVFDVGTTESDQPFLVLEHADLSDLNMRVEALQRDGWTASPADVRALVRVLGQAMNAIHVNELVHRDLSPANILLKSSLGNTHPDDAHVLQSDERMLVADLGFAKDVAQQSGLTVGGGTSSFQAPEQAIAVGTVTAQSDIYAASALVIWLAIGSAPRLLQDWPEIMALEGWPTPFVEALARSVVDDPTERAASADVWMNELLVALDGADGVAGISVVDDRLEEPPSDAPAPKRNALIAMAVVALVAVLGLTVWTSTRPGPDGSPVSTVDGGLVRATETSSTGEQVSIVGPQSLAVGSAGKFVVSGEPDLVAHTWRTPDGATYSETASVEVAGSTPGLALVEVIATTASGEEVKVVLAVMFEP